MEKVVADLKGTEPKRSHKRHSALVADLNERATRSERSAKKSDRSC